MKLNIRLLYLYLFSFVGLLVTVIGTISLVNLGLKTYIFHDADTVIQYPISRPMMAPDQKQPLEGQPTEEELKKQEMEMQKVQERQVKQQRERDATQALAMILVGLPLYAYHWHLAQKEKK